jgi:hypothetical protein
MCAAIERDCVSGVGIKKLLPKREKKKEREKQCRKRNSAGAVECNQARVA